MYKMLKERINIKILCLSIVFAMISFFTDNIIFDKIQIQRQHYLTLKLIYVILIVCIGQLICKLVYAIKRSESVRTAVKFAGICFGILMVFLFLTYPGIWLWDNMEMLSMASTMKLSGWHGYYMQCFFVFALMAIPFPVGVNICQIIIIASVMGRIFYIVSGWIKNKKKAYLLILFLLLPANLYWSLMAYRTAFFGFFYGLAVLEFINLWKNKDCNLIYFVLLYGFIWNIRSEGYGLLLFIPLIAFKLFHSEQKKNAVTFLIGSLIMAGVVSMPIPSDRNYLASAIMNPLECMMKSELSSDNLQRDLGNIDKVFSVDTLKNSEASPISASVEGAAWFKEGFWDNIYCSQEDWNNMLKAYCNLVYFNPQLFLKFRAETMLASINYNKSTINEIESLVNGAEGQFGFDSFNGTKPINEGMRQFVQKLIGYEWGESFVYKVGIILGSAIVPLAMVFVLFVYGVYCRRKELWLSSIVVFATIFIVFLTAPAANSMYYYSLYNSMYLLLVIWGIIKTDGLKIPYKKINDKIVVQNNDGGRIEWLDAVKGIGMLLVIFPHTGLLNENIAKWIYSFHMPLFFILSGYTFTRYKLSCKDFFYKLLKSLIIPYFVYAAGFCIYQVIPNWLWGDEIFRLYSIKEFVVQINCTPLWFVTVLAISEIVCYIIMKVNKSPIWVSVWGLSLFIIGIIYNLQVRIYLPWNADLVFFAVPFVLFGIGLRHVLNIDKVMKVQTLLILFAINVCSELANDRVDMVCRNFGNYLLFFVAAVSGSLFLIGVANRVRKNRALKYIGKNSFFFLGFHITNLLILFVICAKLNIFQSPNEKTSLMLVVVFCTLIIICILRESTLKIKKYIKKCFVLLNKEKKC